ncbi:MAG: ATP-binding protein [Brevinema sp.]
MRINRLIVRKSGPLSNLDLSFKSVTLIVGDNERGKTCLINWITRGLFEKPGKNKFGEIWTDHIDESVPVNCIAEPLSPAFAPERMKNLLFIQKSDLQFKIKDTEHHAIDQFWDDEIQAILYGQDNISDQLQRTFLESMGVKNKNSWLKILQDNLYLLRDTLEDLLPTLDLVRNHENGLLAANKSLGQIDQQEGQIESKQEMYFLAEQVHLGKEYIEMFDEYQQRQQEYKNIDENEKKYHTYEQELLHKEERLFELEDNMGDLKIEISGLKETEQNMKENPLSAYNAETGQNILMFILGSLFVGVSLAIAFYMRTSLFNIYKLMALVLFVLGVVILFVSWIKAMAVQMLSQKEKKSFVYSYVMGRTQKKIHKKNHMLDHMKEEYENLQKECRNLRKSLKMLRFHHETTAQDKISFDRFVIKIKETADKVYHQFGTDDPELVKEKVRALEQKIGMTTIDFDYKELQALKNEKSLLKEEMSNVSQNYQKIKNSLTKQITPLINNLKSNQNIETVYHFYPEIEQLIFKNDLIEYEELINQVDYLCDQINKDIYYAEKLVSIYDQLEYSRDHLLHKALSSPFFRYLVQHVFAGKYERFVVEFDQNQKTMISAITGQGEQYPLESLSSATIAQFWFMLRLVIAKTILGERTGVILLDDPFVSFDSLRKKSFVELLNAFVHQGWQVICTHTDDPILLKEFTDLFGSDMQVVDLNKDFY